MSSISKNISRTFDGEELEVIAYNTIRSYMRDYKNKDVPLEIKGAYVQGIVDYQTELFGEAFISFKPEKEE